MTRYLTLAEFFFLAGEVTGLDVRTLINASRVDLADSALHAPSAGFGDEDFYPEVLEKAAVLVCRLAWNHPLPDGNKRAAWTSIAMFIELNGWTFDPDPPDVDEAEAFMLAVAAHDLDVPCRLMSSRPVWWRATSTRRKSAAWSTTSVPPPNLFGFGGARDAPWPVVAVDLYDVGDDRSRRAAAALLARFRS